MAVLHPNIVMEEYDDQALMEFYSGPRYGYMVRANPDTGVDEVMVREMTFTQADLRAGRIRYVQDQQVRTSNCVVRDSFVFFLLDKPRADGGRPVTRYSKRNLCGPIPTSTMSASPYQRLWFNIIAIPIPRNQNTSFRYPRIVENTSMKIDPTHMRYAVPVDKYNLYLENPPPTSPVYPSANWEQYPVEYKLIRVATTGAAIPGETDQRKAILYKDGVEMVLGDTFDNDDILAGKLETRGTFKKNGLMGFRFRVYPKGMEWKYTEATLQVSVTAIPPPIPKTGLNEIWECQEPRVLLPEELFATDANATDEQIVFTHMYSSGPGKPRIGPLKFTPTTFTMADIRNGLVSVSYDCSATGNPVNTAKTTHYGYFNVCNQYGRCRTVSVKFTVLAYWPPTVKAVQLDTGGSVTKNTNEETQQAFIPGHLPSDIRIVINTDLLAARSATDYTKRLTFSTTDFTMDQPFTVTDNNAQLTIRWYWDYQYTGGRFQYVFTYRDSFSSTIPVTVYGKFGFQKTMNMAVTWNISADAYRNAIHDKSQYNNHPYGPYWQWL